MIAAGGELAGVRPARSGSYPSAPPITSSGTIPAATMNHPSERTAIAFRATTLNCLPTLVASEATNLSARFLNSGAYWSALVSAAVRRDENKLRKVQLFGLQLAAAALLP